MSDIEYAASVYQQACGQPANPLGVSAVWHAGYRCGQEDAARALPDTDDGLRDWLARHGLPSDASVLAVLAAVRANLDPRATPAATPRRGGNGGKA